MNTSNNTFSEEVTDRIASYPANEPLQNAQKQFLKESILAKYSYNFEWMGRPIIQYPQDIVAMQEIIWQVKPDLIIETGIAHGGSLVFYASMLELLGKGEVLGIDIDIRMHNKTAIENHSMFKRITMFEGSSVSKEMAKKVSEFTKGKKNIMVVLDSNHTHDHVFQELAIYAPLVTKGSYLVVFDTVVEDLAALDVHYTDRPWGKGNNPKSAVHAFLNTNDNFAIDKTIQDKLLITVAPDGYLKRVK